MITIGADRTEDLVIQMGRRGDFLPPARSRLQAFAPRAAMHYKSMLIERIFLVRWTSSATADDLRQLLQEMADAHRAAGAKLYHVAFLPPTFTALPSDVRSELVGMLPKLMLHCEAVYNVVEGTGFWASIIRSMLAGFVLASGIHGKSHVYERADRVFERICPPLGLDAAEVMARARAGGIVN